MTRSTSIDVRHLNKRLTKKLKAKAAAVSRAALTKQLLQGLLAKSLLKGRGVAIRMPIPLPWIALLMHHPIQMKPADSENRNERKLFIGMLSKKCNENDVRVMFSSFGTIEECTVLRDTSNQSKGCAFITFSSRQCAINAIKSMNHSQTMEGCNSPLVVKFADTQKEKVIKRQQLMIANLWNMANIANLSSFTPQYLTGSRTSAFSGFVNLPQVAGSLSRMNLQQQLIALAAAHAPTNNSNSGLNPVVMRNIAALASTGGNSASTRLPLAATGNKSRAASMNGKNTKSLLTNMPLGTNSSTMENLTAANGNIRSASNISANGPSLDALAQAYTGMQKMCALPGFSQLSGLHQSQNPAGKQIEGPDGANLFIYHLPQEFNDTDLAQTFLPFGNVISAKVFIDKQTNLSKCFGFVSYDNPANAQAAIQAMNGFQIGMKRLKVQLKRSKDANKPY